MAGLMGVWSVEYETTSEWSGNLHGLSYEGNVL